jgi:hypothetical protein
MSHTTSCISAENRRNDDAERAGPIRELPAALPVGEPTVLIRTYAPTIHRSRRYHERQPPGAAAATGLLSVYHSPVPCQIAHYFRRRAPSSADFGFGISNLGFCLTFVVTQV